MPDARQRLSFYKRLASVGSEYDITAIEEEMADRYGEVPALILNLMQIMSLKFPLKVRAKELIQKGTRLYFAFQDLSGRTTARRSSGRRSPWPQRSRSGTGSPQTGTSSYT